jgi:sensor histidine kinase YesM
MTNLKASKGLSKYTKIEIAFFCTFFFLLPILTDIEVSLNEKSCIGCGNSFTNAVVYRLVLGLFQIVPFLFLYKIILQKLLFQKKYLYSFIAFLVFLFALDFYVVNVQYWAISKLTFLPASITKEASNWVTVKIPLFHFSIIYVFNQTLIFTALAYFINYTKQEAAINTLKQAKLQADLSYLKAQVQPHFFFNTLNNIYALALQQSAQTAPLVNKLSLMMRYVLYETVNPKASLKTEIDFLKNYVDVESIRYNEKIAISFDVQGINDTAVIEPLLLLPLIENMFKHGVQHETENGFIEIIICLMENELTLQAKNSKPSIKIKPPNEAGIGLNNVRKRLQLLYPGKHSLLINENESYYETLLTLQLS